MSSLLRPSQATKSTITRVAPVVASSLGVSTFSFPYTHALHAKRCGEYARNRQVLIQYVQFLTKGTTQCARLAGVWTTPNGLDLWRLELLSPFVGLFYAPPSRVRQCSGLDGHCVCADETRVSAPARSEARTAAEKGFFSAIAPRAFCQAGEVSPPDSLIFENSSVSEA